MATESTSLIIGVDSTRVVKGTKALRDMSDQSRATERQVKGLNTGLERINNVAGGATAAVGRLNRIIGLLGISISAVAFVQFTRNTLAATDELGKLSRQIGISTDALQSWGFAASQSGVGAQALQSSIERLNRRIGEARTGTGELAKIVQELGISTTNSEAAFRDIANAIAGAADEQEQARIAMAAFGREGLQMVRMLQGGNAGLQEFERLAREMGIVLDAELIAKTERFNDAMDQLGRQIRVSFQRGLLQGFVSDFDEAREILLDPAIKEALTELGELLGDVIYLAGQTAAGINRVAQQWRLFTGDIREDNETELVLRIQKVREEIARLERQTRLSPMQREDLVEYRKELEQLSETFSNIRRSHGDVEEVILPPIRVTAQATEAVEDYSEAIEELMDALDPTRVATREYTKAATLLHRALAAGDITVQQYQKNMELLRGTISEMPEETTEVAEAMQDSWSGMRDLMDQTFADIWTDFITGSRNAFDNLRDGFKRLLADLAHQAITRPIMVRIGTAMGFGGGSGTAMASAGGAGGGVDPMSMLQMAQMAKSAISTGFQGIGAAVGSIGASFQYGVTPFSEQAMQLAAQEAGFNTMAGNLATVGSALASVAIGNFVGGIISGGYSAIGKSGRTATTIGSVIGYLIGGPIGGVIGGGIGGLVNRLFGRKQPEVYEQGFRGTIGAGGTDLEQFTKIFQKGGVFRSNKSWEETAALDQQISQPIDMAIRQVALANAAYAEALGLSADAATSFSQEIELNLHGLDESEIAAAVDQMILDFSEAMIAASYPQVEQFQRMGETLTDTFARLGHSLAAINNASELLGMTLLDISVESANTASRLVEMMGGLESFGQSVAQYYELFRTEEEKIADTTQRVTDVLAAFNVELPATRDAFRDLVESQDLSTEAGQNLFATLMQLAPAFDQVYTASERLAEEQIRLAEQQARINAQTLNNLESDVERAFRVVESLINGQIRALETTASEYERMIDSIRNATRSILQDRQFGIASRALSVAAAQARRGIAPTQAELAEILSGLGAGPDPSQFATLTDYQRAQMRTVNQLGNIEDVLEDQITDTERQIQILEDQLDVARAQYNASLGIADAITDLAEAIRLFIQAREALTAAKVSQGQVVYDPTTDTWTSASGTAQTPQMRNMAMDIYSAAGEGAAGAQALYATAVSQGITSSQLDTILGVSPGYSASIASELGLPAFARGGMHRGGLRMVGERGPELEATGPSRIMSNSSLMDAIGSNQELLHEVKQLRIENLAAQRAIEKNTREIRQIEERWDRTGLPEERVFA